VRPVAAALLSRASLASCQYIFWSHSAPGPTLPQGMAMAIHLPSLQRDHSPSEHCKATKSSRPNLFHRSPYSILQILCLSSDDTSAPCRERNGAFFAAFCSCPSFYVPTFFRYFRRSMFFLQRVSSKLCLRQSQS